MVLITGSNSFSGRALIKKFVDEGEEVRCIDYFKPKQIPPGIEYLTGDILDESILKTACKDVDAVFHLKDIIKPGSHGKGEMKKINTEGTKKILERVSETGINKFFYMSSYLVYGKHKKMPLTPESRRKPDTTYGKHKDQAESICMEYQSEYGIDITIFRPALICGAGIDDYFILLMLYLALAVDESNTLYLSKKGENRFQLIHPDDIANAFYLAYKSEESAGKIYNLGSDNVPEQIDLFNEIKKKLNLNFSYKIMPPIVLNILSILFKIIKSSYFTKEHLQYLKKDLILDCSAAKEDLQWQPLKNNYDIMLETVDWYLKYKM